MVNADMVTNVHMLTEIMSWEILEWVNKNQWIKFKVWDPWMVHRCLYQIKLMIKIVSISFKAWWCKINYLTNKTCIWTIKILTCFNLTLKVKILKTSNSIKEWFQISICKCRCRIHTWECNKWLFLISNNFTTLNLFKNFLMDLNIQSTVSFNSIKLIILLNLLPEFKKPHYIWEMDKMNLLYKNYLSWEMKAKSHSKLITKTFLINNNKLKMLKFKIRSPPESENDLSFLKKIKFELYCYRFIL